MKLSSLLIATAVSMTLAVHAHATDRGKAYVSNQKGGVTVIDLNTYTAGTDIDVQGDEPRGIAITEDGKLLVVATRENGSVSIIDTATNQVLSQVKVGQNPEFVRIKGHYAFVSYEPSAKGGPPPAPGSADAQIAAAAEKLKTEREFNLEVFKNDNKITEQARQFIANQEEAKNRFNADVTKMADIKPEAKATMINTNNLAVDNRTNEIIKGFATEFQLKNSDAAKTSTALLTA